MSSPLVIRFVQPGSQAPARSVLAAPTASVPEELATAWRRALAVWDDSARHDALLSLAVQHRQFAWLAAHYRAIAKQQPTDKVAPKRLVGLQCAALATYRLDVKEPAKGRMPYRAAILLIAGSIFLTLLGLWVLDVHSHVYHPPPMVETGH